MSLLLCSVFMVTGCGNNSEKVDDSKYSIYEACEYVNSFLHFYPETAIILNIDSLVLSKLGLVFKPTGALIVLLLCLPATILIISPYKFYKFVNTINEVICPLIASS